MKSIVSIIVALGLSTFGCGDEKKEDKNKGTVKTTTEVESTASAEPTEQEKAWQAWKEDACKCKDLSCFSQMADKQIALKKEKPVTEADKKILTLLYAGNSCMREAAKKQKPPTP